MRSSPGIRNLLLPACLLLFGAVTACIREEPSHSRATDLPPAAQGDGVPLPLDVVWCVRDDASGAQMAAFASRIQASSDALWLASRGQIYLRNVILVDQGAFGHVILDNLSDLWAGGQLAWVVGLGGKRWEIHLGGAYPMQAWLHEIGHSELLQDWAAEEEYTLAAGPIPCIMGAYLLGSGEGEAFYCDQSNCQTSRNGCWESFILPAHPNWTYPRTPGPAPTVTITIHDN